MCERKFDSLGNFGFSIGFPEWSGQVIGLGNAPNVGWQKNKMCGVEILIAFTNTLKK